MYLMGVDFRFFSSHLRDENHGALQNESASVVGPPQWEHLLPVLCIRPDREGGMQPDMLRVFWLVVCMLPSD